MFVCICVLMRCAQAYYSNMAILVGNEKEFASVTCLIEEDGSSLCVACSYCLLTLLLLFNLCSFLLDLSPFLHTTSLNVIVVVVMVSLTEPVMCEWGFFWFLIFFFFGRFSKFIVRELLWWVVLYVSSFHVFKWRFSV